MSIGCPDRENILDVFRVKIKATNINKKETIK